MSIGQIIIEEMRLQNVCISYAGGDRGWIGDVPIVRYNVSKIKSLGWEAKYSSDDAVRIAVKKELIWRKENNIPTDLTI
jgi:UDP-glucose 4-epimerase